MLKNMKYQRDDGGTIDLIQILIGILAIVFILLFNMSMTNVAARRNRIELIAHEYILRMESEGRLTPDMKQELLSDLEENGMKGVSLYSTTVSTVHYGEKITLRIKGRLETSSYNFNSRKFTLEPSKTNISVDVTKKSVSRFTD